MKDITVLFLTVSAGGGHNKVAQSLKKYIEINHKNSKCIIMDTLKEINPLVDKVVIGSYMNTLKASPKLYGKLYEFADHTDSVNDFSRKINKILAIKLHKLLHSIKPDVIVCSHPFPIEMLNVLKLKNKIDIPVITIITDYYPHSFWLYSEVDKYILGSDNLKHEILEKNIEESKVFCLGLPVDEVFTVEHTRSEALKTLSLKDMPTILIMGGSMGFGNIENTLREIVDYLEGFQIVVICGKNKKLAEKLQSIKSSHDDLQIVGFTDEIALYMSISDILITKPGGMTVTEALNIGIPMALISPIPGQEEKNAKFLLNQGAAILLDANDNIGAVLKQLLENPIRLKNMKDMAKNLARPNAQKDISKLIMETGEEYTKKELKEF